MGEFNVIGKEYEVLDEGGHCFAKGSIVKLHKLQECGYPEGQAYSFIGTSRNFGFEVDQDLYVTQVKAVGEVASATEGQTVPKARVTYLYVVEDEDGAYVKTFDRGYAREVKAELGGKKAGVIITAYAAVKEIR